ncbi:MAG TPA: hypothetical protein VN455_02185 [Methanotrichaceae archaeon]|nr:hypothetical protein [Methanotrichaceae archaeon]
MMTEDKCFGCGRTIEEDEELFVIGGHTYCWDCYENSCEIVKANVWDVLEEHRERIAQLEDKAGRIQALEDRIRALEARPISYPCYPQYIPQPEPLLPGMPIVTYTTTTTGTTGDGSGIRKETPTGGP